MKWKELAAAPLHYKDQRVALVGIVNIQPEMFWIVDSPVHPEHWLRFDLSRMQAGPGQAPMDIRYCDNVPVVMSGSLRQDGTPAGEDAGPAHQGSGKVAGFVLEVSAIRSFSAASAP